MDQGLNSTHVSRHTFETSACTACISIKHEPIEKPYQESLFARTLLATDGAMHRLRYSSLLYDFRHIVFKQAAFCQCRLSPAVRSFHAASNHREVRVRCMKSCKFISYVYQDAWVQSIAQHLRSNGTLRFTGAQTACR